MLPPRTAASRVDPVSTARACAAVSVSSETRFSLPSRCSTTTRIVSAMNSFGKQRKSEHEGHEGQIQGHGELLCDLIFLLRDLRVHSGFCSSSNVPIRVQAKHRRPDYPARAATCNSQATCEARTQAGVQRGP